MYQLQKFNYDVNEKNIGIQVVSFQSKNPINILLILAPAFEGRKEIWDALRGACYAIEQNDTNLAQSSK